MKWYFAGFPSFVNNLILCHWSNPRWWNGFEVRWRCGKTWHNLSSRQANDGVKCPPAGTAPLQWSDTAHFPQSCTPAPPPPPDKHLWFILMIMFLKDSDDYYDDFPKILMMIMTIFQRFWWWLLWRFPKDSDDGYDNYLLTFLFLDLNTLFHLLDVALPVHHHHHHHHRHHHH